MRFVNKVVLVTGAGSGIGQVMAGMFAAEGARVVVLDQHGDAAQRTVESIEACQGEAVAVTADITDEAGVAQALSAADERFGGLDVLVNNAAVCVAEDLVDSDPAVWDRDVAVVLRGTYLCTRAAIPRFVARGGGSVVNIVSVNGLTALGNDAYSAAKAGVISMTRAVAVKHGPDGVRANAVAPGTIRTPYWIDRIQRNPEVFEQLVKWYPLGRVGEPEDVARAVMFLASDDASWITGEVLRVDGGLLAGNQVMTNELLVRDDYR